MWRIAWLLPLAVLAPAVATPGAEPGCDGVAPVATDCQVPQIDWTSRSALTADAGSLAGQLEAMVEWKGPFGLRIRETLRCLGPEGPQALPTLPYGCITTREPAWAHIPPGVPVRLECEAQARFLGPLVVLPAGPWACGVAER